MTKLKKCPFCKDGETHSEGKYMPPTMDGKHSLACWEIHHWCERAPGVIFQTFTVRGREKKDAVAAWNARAERT